MVRTMNYDSEHDLARAVKSCTAASIKLYILTYSL